MAHAQEDNIIYILEDGSFYSTTATGANITVSGNVYTINQDLTGFGLVVQYPNAIVDGGGHMLSGASETAVELSYASGVTIRNLNIVGSYFYGILMLEASGVTIEDCSISGNVRGLYVYNSTGSTFTGNTITNNEIGMDMQISSGSTFRNNNFDNTQNLAVFGEIISHYALDIDTSNTVKDKKIYWLINKENMVISPSTHSDLGMLALINCKNMTVSDLEIKNNGQGLILAYSINTRVYRNTFSDNHNGILIFSSSSNELTNNVITKCFRALQISRTSTYNTVNSNNITNNNQGILLFDSSSNTFVGNFVENNEMGIGFNSASNNMIRSNHFVNNTQQVYDAGATDSTLSTSNNYWNFEYPIGGNYWSDYVGLDVKSGENQDETGSDGFGDSPYEIYSGNQDNYPLLPYGSPFAVAIDGVQNKTYSSNSVSFTFTASNSEATVSYSLDGQANATITEGKTLSDLEEGPHKLTVYAKDTDGTETSDTVYFSISEEQEPTPSENEETEELPITLIAAAVLIVAAIAVVLLYFMKLKK
jgi:parallel beta-helix repeat protein